MTDEPSIPPALTAPEWADRLDPSPDVCPIFGNEAERQEWIRERIAESVAYHGDHRRLHAAAALALYGHPFGFTHEDVRFLREEVGILGEDRCCSREEEKAVSRLYDQFAVIRAKIAALLPPE